MTRALRRLVLVGFAGAASSSNAAAASAFNAGTALDGGIVTRYDVQEYADFAWDLRDLAAAHADPQSLYEKGSHAKSATTGAVIPLKYLSDVYFTSPRLVLTPNYLFHIYGLTGTASTDLATRLAAKQRYQSDAIARIIAADPPALASDAVLALSVWMHATHLLYTAVLTCQDRTAADNAALFEPVRQLDQFIALYIGRNQTAGTSRGYGLYAWTQRVDDDVASATTTTVRESAVNARIKLLYQEGTTALSLATACTSGNPGTVLILWNVATQIVTEMMKPLVKWFVYHLLAQNQAATDLYATALLPQLVRCRPSLYNRLSDPLLAGRSMPLDSPDEILRDLVEALACLGIGCREIADVAPDNLTLQQCGTGDDQPPSLAGYRATSAVAPVRIAP